MNVPAVRMMDPPNPALFADWDEPEVVLVCAEE